MLVKSDVKKVKEYPNPEQTSKMMRFYLPRQQFMDPGREYFAEPIVNGYRFKLKFGAWNEAPADVVSVLKNATSAISPNPGGMSTPHRVDTARGGEAGGDGSQVRYIPDYDIQEEKEL